MALGTLKPVSFSQSPPWLTSARPQPSVGPVWDEVVVVLPALVSQGTWGPPSHFWPFVHSHENWHVQWVHLLVDSPGSSGSPPGMPHSWVWTPLDLVPAPYGMPFSHPAQAAWRSGGLPPQERPFCTAPPRVQLRKGPHLHTQAGLRSGAPVPRWAAPDKWIAPCGEIT